jgi:hypothetical protein
MAISEKNLGNYFALMALAEMPFLLGAVWIWFDSGRLDWMLLSVAGAVVVTALFLMFGVDHRRAKLVGAVSVIALLLGVTASVLFDDPWLISGGIAASMLILQFIWPRVQADDGGLDASR